MKGKCIVIVGGAGTGKSTLLKKLIADVPPSSVLLYDVNNEHKEYTRYEMLPDIEDFLLQASLSRRVIIACEEASIFFTSHNKTEEMLNILTRRRHTYNGIILIFHSLRAVPDYMISYINHLIILKTSGDSPEKTDKKFNNDLVLQAYERINTAPWLENNGIRFSPHEIVNIS